MRIRTTDYSDDSGWNYINIVEFNCPLNSLVLPEADQCIVGFPVLSNLMPEWKFQVYQLLCRYCTGSTRWLADMRFLFRKGNWVHIIQSIETVARKKSAALFLRTVIAGKTPSQFPSENSLNWAFLSQVINRILPETWSFHLIDDRGVFQCVQQWTTNPSPQLMAIHRCAWMAFEINGTCFTATSICRCRNF